MSGWNEAGWFAVFVAIALKSTVVLAAAWVAARVLRRRSAAERHLVWTAAAAAILTLPVLSVALPSLHVPSPAILEPESAFFSANANAASSTGSRSEVRSVGKAGPVVSLGHSDWRLWVMLLWSAGALVLLAEVLVACAAVRRVRRSAPAFPERGLTCALSQQLGVEQPVEVRESPAGSMPLTGGVLRSFVLMPSDAALWSNERRRMVLLHELAHVRRGDVATQMLARVALILCWWNPLAWKAWSECVKESERAADDLVINAGACASEYASHLLEVARSMTSGARLGWAAVTMARRSQLEGRLLAILDAGANRRGVTRASVLTAGLLVLALLVPLAAVRADSKQSTAASAMPADVDAFMRTAAAQRNPVILDDAARVADQLRKYDVEQKLLEAANTIRMRVSGPQSAEYGRGLLRLGDVQRKRGDRDSAVLSYGQAVQVLGNRPDVARALFYLGAAALAKKDFAEAVADFERGQVVDAAQGGVALMWMAVAREQEQKTDEATSLYRDALAQQDPNSQEAVTTMTLYAQFLRLQGHGDEAADVENRMAAAKKAIAAQTRWQPARSVVFAASSPGVQHPALVDKVEAQYTDEARAAKLQGTTVLQIEIGADGLVHDSHVVSGVGLGLDENAVDAVSQWHFKPAVKDGQAVPVAATVEINWRLL